jgi:hypothetical protein
MDFPSLISRSEKRGQTCPGVSPTCLGCRMHDRVLCDSETSPSYGAVSHGQPWLLLPWPYTTLHHHIVLAFHSERWPRYTNHARFVGSDTSRSSGVEGGPGYQACVCLSTEPPQPPRTIPNSNGRVASSISTDKHSPCSDDHRLRLLTSSTHPDHSWPVKSSSPQPSSNRLGAPHS